MRSGVGGVSVLLPLRERSSGVNRPFVVRWKNIGEVGVVVDTAGDMGLDARVVEAFEFDRYMPDPRVCFMGGGC